jgi:hypothetical protein
LSVRIRAPLARREIKLSERFLVGPELDPKIKRGEQPKPKRKSISHARISAQGKREKLYGRANRADFSFCHGRAVQL